MWAGFAVLSLAVVLSQFFRAFLAVLSPVLGAELGATADDLALASGLWFAVFAGMQLPIGVWLDRYGPRRSSAWIFGLGAGVGAALFALAWAPWVLVAAMCLIGAGCAPVLMASLYIVARRFRPAVFASLAGLLVGLGSLGNLLSAAPLAWAVEAWGWRAAVGALAMLSVLVALALAASITDPERHEGPDGGSGLAALLRVPALWVMVPLLLMNYAPAAGIRGLWTGPYLGDVFGLDASGIGLVVLGMAAAMVVGNFAYGAADRFFGSRKWVLIGGNGIAAAALVALGLFPAPGVVAAAVLLAAIGFFGSSFPLIMAHARSYFPPHLVGRGVTFANFLSIGGVGLMQIASGRLHAWYAPAGAEAAFGALFLFFGLVLGLAAAAYLLAEDRLD